VDITPGRELTLVGYGFRRDVAAGNDGPHDPLHARVLVLDDGHKPAVWISLDLCMLPTEIARSLRSEIGAKLETDPDRVLLAATHTHSGPMPVTKEMVQRRKRKPRVPAEQIPEVAYFRMLRARLLAAALQARALTFPVEAFVREAPLGIAYDRRARTAEGVKHCWGPQEWPDRPPGPAADPTCTVVMFRQTNGPRTYVVWDVGAHPVVLGKTSRVVSADYPGAACRLIEQYVPGARSMFFLGAAGDTHPWIATQEDAAQIEPVARAAASFVALLCQAGRPVADGAAPRIRVAARSLALGDGELDVSVWRLGDLWVATVPVELFGALGADLRRRLGGPVLLVTMAGGAEGYLPTRKAFEEGGYEVEGARRAGFQGGDGEKLIDALVGLADRLR
jgi:hypothetical protein